MKSEHGAASDVDVYVASVAGKTEISIVSVAFNNKHHAEVCVDAVRSALSSLEGVELRELDVDGAFISFVKPWPEEAVTRLFEGIALDLSVSVSIDLVSRSAAEKLYRGRR